MTNYIDPSGHTSIANILNSSCRAVELKPTENKETWNISCLMQKPEGTQMNIGSKKMVENGNISMD